MATNFFHRWSNRKLTPIENTERAIAEAITEAVDESLTLNSLDTTVEEVTKSSDNTSDSEQTSIVSSVTSPNAIAEEPVIELTIDDADNVTYDSGVASFMQQQVTKSVKKAALRKLFHSEEFNYISEMDDSTEDFSNIEGLAPEIASQMRGWIKTVTETVTENIENDGISLLTSTTPASSPVIDSTDPSIDVTTVVTSTKSSAMNHVAIEGNETKDDLLVNNTGSMNTDENALPTADLSVTPIINRDEQKS